MILIKSQKTSWENQHETFKEKVKEFYTVGNGTALSDIASYNDTTKGLQDLVRQAIANDVSLRTLGAGWSWTKIATAKDGIMVDTKPLNKMFLMSPDYVVPGRAADSRKLVFAQCGAGVWELSRELRSLNLSLKTSGASNGQTIVGAMSTGAHGSTFDVGAVQDFVLGLHVIVGPDRHVWLERKTDPVVTQKFADLIQTEIVSDDDLFNAALVSFGSFGIIHGVLLETDDLFLLETNIHQMEYNAGVQDLMRTLDFTHVPDPLSTERPYHFAVSINPYDDQKGAYVSQFYKRPFTNNYQRPTRNAEGIGPGDDAPCFIGKLLERLPRAIPGAVSLLVHSSLSQPNKQTGTWGEIFSNTDLHGKLLSAAIGIRLQDIHRVTQLLFEFNKKTPFAGIFAYRFIKKSKATLAFTRFEFTCVLELDGAFSKATQNYYTRVWNRLEEEGIPFTFHWGKMNELDPQRIENMYGDDAIAWVRARNKLLDKPSLKVFSNPLLAQWGLDTIL